MADKEPEIKLSLRMNEVDILLHGLNALRLSNPSSESYIHELAFTEIQKVAGKILSSLKDIKANEEK